LSRQVSGQENAVYLAKIWNGSLLEAFGGCGMYYLVGELNPMSKQDEYLNDAAQTLELAMRAPSFSERSRLLNLANKWLDLADRFRQQSEATTRGRNEHPLVKRAFRGLSR
jgi:hypothetical protein